MSKKRVRYSQTFMTESIAKIKENKGNISQTDEELGILMQTLANWHLATNGSILAGTEGYNPELIAALHEIKELKKTKNRPRRTRNLKKATAYFAMNP